MELVAELTREIINSLSNAYSSDNHDTDRFGPLSAKQRIAGVALKGLSRLGLHRTSIDRVNNFFWTAEPLFDGLAELHAQLDDEPSKHLLVKVLAYRALGCA